MLECLRWGSPRARHMRNPLPQVLRAKLIMAEVIPLTARFQETTRGSSYHISTTTVHSDQCYKWWAPEQMVNGLMEIGIAW